MPAKPVKHGFKFYALCDSITGNCLKIHIYSGYEEEFVSREGFTYNLCNHLMSDYFNNNHVLYTDHYYTSIKSLLYLKMMTHLIRENQQRQWLWMW